MNQSYVAQVEAQAHQAILDRAAKIGKKLARERAQAQWVKKYIFFGLIA